MLLLSAVVLLGASGINKSSVQESEALLYNGRMKHLAVHLIIVLLTFIVGVSASTVWSIYDQPVNIPPIRLQVQRPPYTVGIKAANVETLTKVANSAIRNSVVKP